ncbi:SCO family protein [Ectothiorhodospiraceae bacterium BW-2]|nr:SCO family protein [Ectothiorhodospiraceae bacterium BW-2]
MLTDHLGGDFTLQGEEGPVTLSDYRGKVVILYFGYTSCPDVCPMSLSIMRRTMQQLSEDQATQVQGIFVTVDPERDKGEALQHYVRFFYPTFIGLRGSESELKPIARQWGVGYQKQASGSALGYLLAHTDYLYLLDQQGELAGLFHSLSQPEELIGVIEALLKSPPHSN